MSGDGLVERMTGQSVRVQVPNVGAATGFLRRESAEYLAGMTPAPQPSEVAETTAGEREDRPREPWEEYTADRWWLAPPTSADEPGGLYELARDNTFMRAINFGIDDFRMGRQSNVALAESLAKAALASPALAALLDRVRREEGERVLRRLADDIDPTGYGWTSARDARRFQQRLLARAASVGRGEGL